jgi:hypothetical protein
MCFEEKIKGRRKKRQKGHFYLKRHRCFPILKMWVAASL